MVAPVTSLLAHQMAFSFVQGDLHLWSAHFGVARWSSSYLSSCKVLGETERHLTITITQCYVFWATAKTFCVLFWGGTLRFFTLSPKGGSPSSTCRAM
jgi:hypothetical protein